MTDELTPEWAEDDAPEWTLEDFARAEIRKGSEIIRPERKRGELTLREKVLGFLDETPVPMRGELGQVVPKETIERIIDRMAGQLEDTGSLAHMRVAAELRGE